MLTHHTHSQPKLSNPVEFKDKSKLMHIAAELGDLKTYKTLHSGFPKQLITDAAKGNYLKLLHTMAKEYTNGHDWYYVIKQNKHLHKILSLCITPAILADILLILLIKGQRQEIIQLKTFNPSLFNQSLKVLDSDYRTEYELKIRKILCQSQLFNTTLNAPVLLNNTNNILNTLLSIKRKLDHERRFGPTQNYSLKIPSLLLNEKYKHIYRMILEISGDPKGPHIIPYIIDHWTKLKNFQSICKHNAFYGHASLKKHHITFIPNALGSFDKKNLDENVICFSPGGFVDPIALMNNKMGLPHSDLLRLRLDLSKLKTLGKFNTFFKAVDLGMGFFKVELNLTEKLTVSIEKKLWGNPITNNASTSEYNFIFKLKGAYPLETTLEDNELIYYGDLAGINRFCLLLPFIALQTSNDKIQVERIYTELNNLNSKTLKKTLITLAQNATLFSEYNFNGVLHLTPQSIYDIHLVSYNTTYEFQNLSKEAYDKALQYFRSDQIPKNIPLKTEKIFEYQHEEESEINLYNQPLNYKSFEPTLFKINAMAIQDSLFENGYTETRPGRSSSTTKKSYKSVFFASKKDSLEQSLETKNSIQQLLNTDCNLPENTREIIHHYLK
ncbi:MAG: hypothetical protein JO097_14425 [Acidobacteriaceae bacterium]|nr:hypothetical protein [Gammaproteobacteria bacterium]MBV9157457.1 hypothetical protein [Acidobacteriaceae bacterium]